MTRAYLAFTAKGLALAEKLAADMIIIGSEHKGLWTQLIEGSTSKSLVGQSTVPVLVVPVKV